MLLLVAASVSAWIKLFVCPIVFLGGPGGHASPSQYKYQIWWHDISSRHAHQRWHLMRSPCRHTKGQELYGFASRTFIQMARYAHSTRSTKFCTKHKESLRLSIQGFKQRRCRWRIHPTLACGPKTSWSGQFPRSPQIDQSVRKIQKASLSAGRECPQQSQEYVYCIPSYVHVNAHDK